MELSRAGLSLFWAAALLLGVEDALTRRLSLPLLGLLLVGAALAGGSLPGALVCGGLLAAAWAAGRGALGGGDVVVAAAAGLLLGPERGILALVVGTGLAALPALILVLRGRGRTPLPLGSFLLGAAVIVSSLGPAG